MPFHYEASHLPAVRDEQLPEQCSTLLCFRRRKIPSRAISICPVLLSRTLVNLRNYSRRPIYFLLSAHIWLWSIEDSHSAPVWLPIPSMSKCSRYCLDPQQCLDISP